MRRFHVIGSVLLLLILSGLPTPASATTLVDCGYESAGLAAYQAAGHEVLGSTEYGLAPGECTWFVAAVVPSSQYPWIDVWSGRDAKNWFARARDIGLPTGTTPAVGAIMCMDGDTPGSQGHGHVGVVLAIDGATMTIADSNFIDYHEVGIHTESPANASYYHIQGYIYRSSDPSPPGIIDEKEAVRGGPSGYWHTVTGLGSDGDMVYTYSNGDTVMNWMAWRSGLSPGRYEVRAFIPRNYATTRSARYLVEYCVGDAWTVVDEVTVNQYNYYDEWVLLGTYDFPGEPAVFLGDDTGEPYSPDIMIGFEAISFQPAEATSDLLHGVDVSKHQGTIDWDALASSTGFAIIRSSFGCPDPGESVSQYTDSEFARNQAEARRVGLPRGYYHYCYPDINDPEPEADQFLNVVGVLEEGEVLCLDLEEPTSKDPVDWCVRFLDRVYERTGVRPLLYVDKSRADSYDWSRVIDGDYGLWLAYWDYVDDFGSAVTQWPFAAMKQYSTLGDVAGLSPVDLDVFNGSIDEFLAYGYHGAVALQWEGLLDQPDPGTTVAHDSTFICSGWVWDQGEHYSVERVEILVNGEYVGAATYGEWREDLGQSIGYSFAWDPGAWAGQTVSITARAFAETPSGEQSWDMTSTGVVVTPDAVSVPVADFSATLTQGVAPLDVSFSDLSANAPSSWLWAFGDGATSAEENPSHRYEGAGVYTVSLTATNTAGSDTQTKPRFVLVTFPDVPLGPPEHWALHEILACVDAGIVQGYPDGTYAPTAEVTRDQMAVYISRALAGGDALVPEGPATATFDDVPRTGSGAGGTEPYWAYKYIEYCVARGVVRGYDATHYRPDVVVTRDQMAVFVAKAKGWVQAGDDMTTASELFSDVPAGFWSGTAIETCLDHGVVHGYAGNTYHPEYAVTRDQMAVYVARAFALPPRVNVSARIQGPPDGDLAAEIVPRFIATGGEAIPAAVRTVSLGADGRALVDLGLPFGRYGVWGKVPTHWARRLVGWSFTADVTTLDLGALLAGDLANDNVVSQADVDHVNGVWLTTDPVADINRDGVVNSLDYALLNANSGVAGDP